IEDHLVVPGAEHLAVDRQGHDRHWCSLGGDLHPHLDRAAGGLAPSRQRLIPRPAATSPAVAILPSTPATARCTPRGSSAACSAPGWEPSAPGHTGWCA